VELVRSFELGREQNCKCKRRILRLVQAINSLIREEVELLLLVVIVVVVVVVVAAAEYFVMEGIRL
jgi:hypothetical protein